jgi:hypothetical protein
MLSSKTTGWMLIMGLAAVIVVIIAISIQAQEGTVAEMVAWAAENEGTWQIVISVNMVANVLLVIFTIGFISWAQSIDQSGGAISIGKYLALLALVLIWVGDISQGAGFETAEENADAAHSLISLCRSLTWIGISVLLGSFFVVGTTAYIKKVGTPVLNVLLGLVGLVGCIGSYVPGDISGLFWTAGFAVGMILMTIIGVQKVRS